MNVSTDRKTHKKVHNKKKKQKNSNKQSKENAVHKARKKPSSHHKFTRTTKTITTSIMIATSQPTLLDAPIVYMPAAPISATPSTHPSNDQFDMTGQDDDDGDNKGFFSAQYPDDKNKPNHSTSIAAAAAIHKMEDRESITQQQPESISTTTQATQIAAPVIGVFGGIVLIAAAMFYVVRKRKRSSILLDNGTKKPNHDDNDNKHADGGMHDISLLDEDEGIVMIGQPPRLAPATMATTTANTNTISDMNCHHRYSTTVINLPENGPVNNSTNMTGLYNRDSYSSQASSINPPPPPLSCGNASSLYRSSFASTVYTDALTSPRSSIFEGVGAHHISSFLMIAERQQLQHQKPNILDHFNQNNEIKSSQSTPIETYKAQLANLADMDEQEEQEEQGHINDVLPFFTIVDLKDIY